MASANTLCLIFESSLHIAINASVLSSLQPAIFATFRYPGVETEAQCMLENGSENRFVLTAIRTVPERFWNHLICGSGLERNGTVHTVKQNGSGTVRMVLNC